ncbi:hypothetical protein SAMN05444287_1029 [Octadecabacter temperatus]|uniref:Uncharacterized protein n=2 Tax=Octadecabacter temperatus TaxID=1458307 RepID=A0A0K0Y4N8_9RHOB|nr:hypothetical protein OSB_13720 [Octadecabacter temperatus]SIO03614.1 hypothetical protein SAMN05444287_1029 [Octadecabacter temperatus]
MVREIEPSGRIENRRSEIHMWRLIKFLFVLVVLAAIAFIAFAYLGPIFMPADFAAPVEEVVVPVTLGGG